jgi:DNA-binding MarR family transcriptional regulator
MPPKHAPDTDAVSVEAQRHLFEHPGHLVRRLHQISVSVFLAEAEQYDLTHLQYASLVVVDAYPGIDQRRLGRAVALDRQTVSVVVRRLVEKGLLRREAVDGRKSALFVTGSGKALYRVMRTHLEAVDRKLMSPLSAAERDVFLATLTKLVGELNELSRAPQLDVKEMSGSKADAPRARAMSRKPRKATAAARRVNGRE